jgi:hypothetical protein
LHINYDEFGKEMDECKYDEEEIEWRWTNLNPIKKEC